MSYQQNQTLLADLRFLGMASRYECMQTDPNIEELCFDELLSLLIDAEVHDRRQRKIQRLLRASKLKYPTAFLENVDFKARRGLEKKTVANLKTCNWIKRYQHMIIEGPTGVGKTWLACAFGQAAIRQSMPVLYWRFPRLIEALEIRLDGSLPNLRARIAKCSLLIVDDWAICPMTVNGRRELFEIFEDKNEVGSLLIASQLPVSEWHDYVSEPTVADAMIDRVVHRSHLLSLKGESMRKLKRSELEVDNV
ncbi:IS21-like element ISFK1 family helper ATPase IstB [Arenicella sp. 4NH20-0111]|uniref:IS21-like element helper ATPase IstB n=1 Tax=Arenicella sp. 4NH20-0111 TaxID=3127648 RepID=UPI00310528F8